MILLIAPYLKMKTIADSIKGRFAVPIQTVVGNLQDAIGPAKAAIAEGQIIVSRGGTAKLVHDTLGVDVIDIGISQFELIRVLRPYIGGSKRGAVVGFRSLTNRVEQTCAALGISIASLPVDDEFEVESRIRSISGARVDYIIGDMISIASAEGTGASLHLIESDEYAIAEALEKAALVAKRIWLQKESDRRIKTVFNSVQDAIIAIDSQGRVEQANLKASELLGVQNLYGVPIHSIIRDMDFIGIMKKGSEVSGKVEDLNGKRTVLNLNPVVVNDGVEGAVIVLQEVGKIQALEKKVRQQLHAKGLVAKHTFEEIFTVSPPMTRCLEIARQYATTECNIVLYGETGTGKELLAQSIHNASPVNDGPFVAVNCGALPPNLLESELFGYVEGAFTGAVKRGKAGLFELAHCGTIFLDEINELDFQLQSKLLRVLQEREIMRVGDTKIIPVSVRVIAASNVPLVEEMEKGNIRRDLFYRLNVLEISIPSLRERPEDIADMFRLFVARLAGEEGAGGSDVSDSLVEALRRHSWPGNVRELENVAERFVVLRRLLGIAAAVEVASSLIELGRGGLERGSEILEGSLKEIETRVVRRVFEEEGRNVSKTAKRLGIDRQTARKYLL